MGTNLGAGLQRTGRLRAPTRNRRQRTRLISGGPARSDDARPFFVFAVDPALKVAGAARYNTKSLLTQKIDHVRCAHAAHCLIAEPSEYLRGCAGRCKQTDPGQRLKLRVAELGDARDIWCSALRSSAVMASAFILPARTCGCTPGMMANIAWMLPASMSVTAGGNPRYGMCTA